MPARRRSATEEAPSTRTPRPPTGGKRGVGAVGLAAAPGVHADRGGAAAAERSVRRGAGLSVRRAGGALVRLAGDAVAVPVQLRPVAGLRLRDVGLPGGAGLAAVVEEGRVASATAGGRERGARADRERHASGGEGADDGERTGHGTSNNTGGLVRGSHSSTDAPANVRIRRNLRGQKNAERVAHR